MGRRTGWGADLRWFCMVPHCCEKDYNFALFPKFPGHSARAGDRTSANRWYLTWYLTHRFQARCGIDAVVLRPDNARVAT